MHSWHHQPNTQSGIAQDILEHVEKPSRYLGTEINRIVKDPNGVRLHMALAFPDLYEIGTSHFGLQILYHLLNRRDEIYVERVFAPAQDMEALLRARKQPLCSLESQTPLAQMDIIGFSLLYELNYTNVLNMLDLAQLPLRAESRDGRHPLIIAGGPCVSNPEPMAPFFDAMVFGDGEQVLEQMADTWMSWKFSEEPRDALLREWSRLEGVYVPAFFAPRYDSRGFQRLEPIHTDYQIIRRAVVGDLDGADFPAQPIVPFGRPIHDRLRLEVSRGCSRGCRFCQAGMIYRPVRERSPGKLLSLTESALAATGYEDLSLLSLSTGDYTCLAPLMEQIIARCRGDRVAVSLPSVRADVLTPDLMTHIKKVRKTGFTIAPEAGSQRLRDVINKNIVLTDVVATVNDAFTLGWRVIKLYFMIGLPTEQEDDLAAIAEMVNAIKACRGKGKRGGQINVSVTTFIPKAHTPFQWAAQITPESARSKIETLKLKLKTSGIKVKWQHPEMSLLEGVLARGDRRLAAAIENAWRLGCIFDGWSDRFDIVRWRQAFKMAEIDVDFFIHRQRSLKEPLPWDHLDSRVNRQFLIDQWHAAYHEETVGDCRHGECLGCGVCDFQDIRPVVFYDPPQASVEQIPVDDDREAVEFELTYTKMGPARFLSHLETAKLFARAFRRARIRLLYSKGFHPMPRISFDNPIPLGMESEGELMWIKIVSGASGDWIVHQLNPLLPDGIRVLDCGPIAEAKSKRRRQVDHYRIQLEQSDDANQRISMFLGLENWYYTRIKVGGRSHRVDLKQCVQKLYWIDQHTLGLHVAQDEALGIIIRPADILESVFLLKKETAKLLRVVKFAENPEN